MTQEQRGLLLILSSPSGAGKSTLARRLLSWDERLIFSVSATTRPPRKGEIDGKDYHFKTAEEFDEMVCTGQMLEHARVFDYHYGSPLKPVQNALETGHDVIFDIDWQGGEQICASRLADDVVSVFILPPSIAALEARLNIRGQDTPEVVTKRMAKAQSEISHWHDYDYVLVNDDLETTFTQLKTIILAERNKRKRKPKLICFVAALNDEFESQL